MEEPQASTEATTQVSEKDKEKVRMFHELMKRKAERPSKQGKDNISCTFVSIWQKLAVI